MKWTKTGTVKGGDGSTTVWYESGKFGIKSHRREIPHTGMKPGGWMYVDYTLYENSHPVKVFHTLKDAKAFAEGMEND